MNNHKLIMEGWRQFLSEDVGNQESGILTGGILQYFTNIIRKMMEDKRVVNAAKQPYPPNKEAYAKIKKTMPGYDDFMKIAEPETMLFTRHMNKYINKSSSTKKYFKIFKSRSTLFKKLKSFKLEVTKANRRSSRFFIGSTGGSMSTDGRELTIKVEVGGFIEPWYTKDNFSWMYDFKHVIQGVTQHEVEHIAQGLRGEPMQDVLNMSFVAIGGRLSDKSKDPFELLASLIMDIAFQKDDTKERKERVLKRWEKWLKAMQYVIDSQKGKAAQETVASKIITYYSQEIEQHAYAVGFVRSAKSITASRLKQQLKNDYRFKKKWFSMSKEDRKKWRSNENTNNFIHQVDTKMNYLKRKARGQKYEKQLFDTIYQLDVIIKDYAARRFGGISRVSRNLLNQRY
tara:strand:- start:3272 stop:4471 length:1200 start_codon:yes stop_codon:yes gene_type:complete